MTAAFLPVKWGTRVTLVDPAKGKRYHANGGGYDMVGTVLGAWLEDGQQAKLVGLAVMNPGHVDHGMRVSIDAAKRPTVKLDGGVGEPTMVRVAAAIGITITRVYDHSHKSSAFLGFLAEWDGA